MGRLDGAFEEIPSPTDSDIHFGQPLFLRADELFSHDNSSMWHFRRVDGRWTRRELDLYEHLKAVGINQFGWRGLLFANGQELWLESWDRLEVFERQPGGVFKWSGDRPWPSATRGFGAIEGGAALLTKEAWPHGHRLTILSKDGAARGVAMNTGDFVPTDLIAAHGRRLVLLNRSQPRVRMAVYNLDSARLEHIELPDDFHARRGVVDVALYGDQMAVLGHTTMGFYRLP